MNIWEIIAKEGKQYLKDAAPGGLLNRELDYNGLRKAGEVASMTPTPVGDVASGLLAVDDLRNRQYGSAALNSLGLLPFVPGMAGMTKKVAKLPYQIEHKPMSKAGGASTLDDLTPSFGEDIYGPNALQYFGSGDAAEKRMVAIMRSLRGKPEQMVTVYRGVPPDVDKINPGDWVTLDRNMASYYATPEAYGEAGKGMGNVLEMKVPAKHITSWPDSLLEFGYFPE